MRARKGRRNVKHSRKVGRLLILASLGLGLATARAEAAQGPFGSQSYFVNQCRGGSNAGAECTTDDECPRGSCRIVKSGSISVKLTIIVHDEVTDFDGAGIEAGPGSTASATTIMLELPGRRRLARTFQNLEGATGPELIDSLRRGAQPVQLFAGSPNTLDEALLRDWYDGAAGGAIGSEPEQFLEYAVPILDLFGFGDTLSARLGVTCPNVLTVSSANRIDLVDGTGTPDASIARFRLRLAVVQLPPGSPC